MIEEKNQANIQKLNGKLSNQERLTQALQRLHNELFDDRGSLDARVSERTDCPVCNSRSSRIYWIKDGFIHVKCDDCGLVYLNPRLTKEATLSFYNSNANEIYNESKFHSVDSNSLDDIINIQNASYLNKYFESHMPGLGIKNQKVIEIGCAKGTFLKFMKEYGAITYGVELNKKNVEQAKNNGVDFVYDKDLLDLNLPSEFFDIVYARDVIEHLFEPKIYFRELNRILKPNGLLFLETHNINGIIHKIVKGRHTCIFGLEHPVHWSNITLTKALNDNGFLVDKVLFSSDDLEPQTVINYFRKSTWTTIYPWKTNFFLNISLIAVNFVLKVTAINFVVGKFARTIANKFSLGSTMKLIAKKIDVTEG